MSKPTDLILEELERLAQEIAPRSHSPYSKREDGCIALLSDGTYVPGVRVENASFPLLIPAAQNALTTALSEGRDDFVAFVSTAPISHVERDLLEPFLPDVRVRGGAAWVGDTLPRPGRMLVPVHHYTFADDADGIVAARKASESARVPESDFPVGCILGSVDGGYVRGVNVEHPDWNLGLCAERNAMGTAATFGLDDPTAMYLSCLKDPSATPCGACRQVLVEFAPDIRLVMDRGNQAPESTTPAALLPDFFAGRGLRDQ